MEQEKKVKIINMEDVEVEKIDWLWYPFIPYGKITILQGDPGEGKTTVMLHIIAALTRGEGLFDEASREPVNVIYQTAEDGLGDTIKPRLLDADADCSKVLVIDDSDRALSISDERLELALEETKAKLIVLDPLQGYLGSSVDMHRANEIRPLMHRLSNVAEKYKCAVVLIGHMNKNSITKSNYRGLGSIDIQAAARSVLLCGRVKDEPETRVICQIKSSLAPECMPVAFQLDEENGFKWIGEYDISIDDLLSGESRGSKSKKAKEFLRANLSKGKILATEVETLALEEGIRKKTLQNAKREEGIKSEKIGDQWYWKI